MVNVLHDEWSMAYIYLDVGVDNGGYHLGEMIMRTIYLDVDRTVPQASFYIDVYGDIFDTKPEAELLGCVAEIVVDSLFVGSMAEMRNYWKDAYIRHLGDEQGSCSPRIN